MLQVYYAKLVPGHLQYSNRHYGSKFYLTSIITIKNDLDSPATGLFSIEKKHGLPFVKLLIFKIKDQFLNTI
jgi:hypothetical protein